MKMKSTNSTSSLTLATVLYLMLTACENGTATSHETDVRNHDHSDMEHSAGHSMTGASTLAINESELVSDLIDRYLAIKNALVQDDSKGAATAGQQLAESASAFDLGSFGAAKQAEINEFLALMKQKGENIAKSEISDQREHFEQMTKDFTGLLEITGTDRKLYQQYCPMYNSNKGGFWLSDSKEIRNPLFGSKMLTCGKVTRTLE